MLVPSVGNRARTDFILFTWIVLKLASKFWGMRQNAWIIQRIRFLNYLLNVCLGRTSKTLRAESFIIHVASQGFGPSIYLYKVHINIQRKTRFSNHDIRHVTGNPNESIQVSRQENYCVSQPSEYSKLWLNISKHFYRKRPQPILVNLA